MFKVQSAMCNFAVAVFICGVCFGAAGAATKCVALDSSKKASSYDYEWYQPDWTATEQDGTVLKGVGVCASAGADNNNDRADTITVGSSNTYCWCKMISPAVSSWVFANDYGSADLCADYCGFNCANFAMNVSDFRAALFGSLQ